MDSNLEKKIVQTQALIATPFLDVLKVKGYRLIQLLEIKDEYYVGAEDLDFPIHTYEKSGEFIRIRNGIPELHTLLKGHNLNCHRVRSVVIGSNLVNEKQIIESKPLNIESVEKKREIWSNGTNEFILDFYEIAIILEIQTEINESQQIEEVVTTQINLLKSLGIEDGQIISDSYIYRKIHFKIQNIPEIRLKLLEKELQELTKKLREKEMLSGEAFADTGDGWHENPTYETIYHEMMALNTMIIETREEIIKIKTSIQA